MIKIETFCECEIEYDHNKNRYFVSNLCDNHAKKIAFHHKLSGKDLIDEILK